MTADHSEAEATDVSTDDDAGLARRAFLGAVTAAVGCATAAGTGSADHPDPATIVSQMSIDQKIHMVHGVDVEKTGHIPPLHEFDIPGINMLDGPVGVRTESEQPMTAFPASIAAAASFDTDLMGEQGEAMGREAKSVDTHCLLGPALNIHRVPTCGRNFEYYSEDPHLTARMATASTAGIQAENVVATPKHYAANNQETNRKRIDARVSERALREIYLPGFEACVRDGDAGSVMSAYNRVNGDHCTANEHLLTDVLKDDWGFDGYVVSDWDAMNTTVKAANAGQDLEMWMPKHFGSDLRRAVENGEVPESRLDDMVERVLRPYAETGHLDGQLGPGERNTDEHQRLARRIAESGATLLKNDGDVLPVDANEVGSVAVVGDASDAIVGGGGAAAVDPPYAEDPLSAIRDYVGSDVQISTARNAGGVDRVAGDADVVFAFGEVESSEFRDRDDMHLQRGDDDLIQAAADANPNTVAVLRIPGPVVMPWVDDVAGVLSMWYGGLEEGTATANVLFGEVNPSGKLPTTFGKRFADYPASETRQFPGRNGTAHYDEGVFVGYRHFDREGIEPLFPFGHGESYTEFEYSNLQVQETAVVSTESQVSVSVDVTNTGERAGAEVVQIYVADVEASVERPPKELEAFAKPTLSPGQTETVTFELDHRAFRFWDPDAGEWTVEDGEFEILVGASSRDIRLRDTVGGEPSGPAPIDGTTPRDVGGDGTYEDLNANGDVDYDDVVTYFEHMDDPVMTDHVAAYDYNGNQEIDFADVVSLFQEVS